MNITKKLLSMTAALAITVTTLVSGSAALAEEPASNAPVKIVENGAFGHADPDNDRLLDPSKEPTAEDVKAGKAGEGKKKNSAFKADAGLTLAKGAAPTFDRSISTFEKTVHSGNTTRSVKLDVGNLNATASADASLSIKDGMRVQVNTQATVTAAKVTGSIEYNNGTYSGKATGSIGVGVARVKGNAKANIGPKGADVDVSLSAEANLVEAKGELTGSAKGAEVKVTGTLAVGVGAKAGATIKDGKINIEAGASAGLGGSLNVEVDVSKLNLTNERPKNELEKRMEEEKKFQDGLGLIVTPHRDETPTGLPNVTSIPNLGTSIFGKVRNFFGI